MEYFKKLAEEIENGGREGFLDYMLNFKRNIDLNKLPKVQAKQKAIDILTGASPVAQFLWHISEEGLEDLIIGTAAANKDRFSFEELDEYENIDALWEIEPAVIRKTTFFKLFLYFCDEHQIRRVYYTPQTFWTLLTRLGVYASRRNRNSGSGRGKDKPIVEFFKYEERMKSDKKACVRIVERLYFQEFMTNLLINGNKVSLKEKAEKLAGKRGRK